MGVLGNIEIRLLSPSRPGDNKLKAFATAEIPSEGWVIANIKIVEVRPGELDVFWPSIPVMGRCPHTDCGQLNPITHHYCGKCGQGLPGMENTPNAYRYLRDVIYPKDPDTRKEAVEEILKVYREMTEE